MKTLIRNLMGIIIYFFSPEDSGRPVRHGYLSFTIDPGNIGMGSAKALFWVMNAAILVYLLTLL